MLVQNAYQGEGGSEFRNIGLPLGQLASIQISILTLIRAGRMESLNIVGDRPGFFV